ncbi:MAG: hypothetical protein JNL57_13590 [Bacteroidetes bacterium]|nr:hypothetical protein [Bacteroidota bacterium]
MREERFSEDVRFVRSLLTLIAGDQGKARLVNFYRRMAKANAEKRFTSSSIKTELNDIATALHDTINEGKSRVSVDSGLKDKLLAIREKHSLSASVKVLKRFYNLIGQSPSQKQAELLLKAADKIGESDAYYPEVKRVIFRLKQFIDNNEQSITIDKPTIQGLAGVLKNCGCKLSAGNWEDVVKK